MNSSRKENTRDASFDYCFNYFHRFYEDNKIQEIAAEDNLEKSCLQLGFYLASWGMYRGSSKILNFSVKKYENLITEISNNKNKVYWEIDVDNYKENSENLINCYKLIKNSFGKEINPSDTLITKIMLGIFGSVPAFDTYFKAGMKHVDITIGKFNKKALEKIYEFYLENQEHFKKFNIQTIDFITGKNIPIIYTKAKLIDMAAFQEGLNQKKK